ncbi:MAG: hypothetical protein AAFX06_08790, partial [Planctomycetota bacterium]
MNRQLTPRRLSEFVPHGKEASVLGYLNEARARFVVNDENRAIGVVAGGRFSDGHVELLKELEFLERFSYLSVWKPLRLGPSGIRNLFSISALGHVSIQVVPNFRSSITDELAEAVEASPRLHELLLPYSRLSDAGVDALTRFR